MLKFRYAKDKLEKENGIEPTIEEVAEVLGISIERAEILSHYQEDTKSINTLVGEDHDLELVEFIAGTSSSTEDEVMDSYLPNQILELFNKCNLKGQEIDVLICRYGLNNNAKQTLREVGQKYGVTRERIRQIEINAIKKIRKSEAIREFLSYANNPNEALENLEQYKILYSKTKSKTIKLT
jgi:RNA polymerase primary sigma factor